MSELGRLTLGGGALGGRRGTLAAWRRTAVWLRALRADGLKDAHRVRQRPPVEYEHELVAARARALIGGGGGAARAVGRVGGGGARHARTWSERAPARARVALPRRRRELVAEGCARELQVDALCRVKRSVERGRCDEGAITVVF